MKAPLSIVLLGLLATPVAASPGAPAGELSFEDLPEQLRPEARELLERMEAMRGRVLTSGDFPDLMPAEIEPPTTIRVWRRSIDGSSDSCAGRVDVMDFDDYVKGVLPGEWYPSWHVESLKAGSVAIRTYAAWWVLSGGKYDCADVDDTTATQAYHDRDDFPEGHAPYLPKTDDAIDETSGVFLVENGELVFSEYSAENGNPTDFGVEDPLCEGEAIAGHRRGMCQWGSHRWADQAGKTWDWIAVHYYPGAELLGIEATPDPEPEPEPDPETELDADSGDGELIGGCAAADGSSGALAWFVLAVLLRLRRRSG